MAQVRLSLNALKTRGIEVLPRGGPPEITLPRHTVIEAPSSLKWTRFEHSIELGAFSYQVSGFCFAARIGRYCSFGEDVEIGRQDHPTDWVSTSPTFYLGDRVFTLEDGFTGAEAYHGYAFRARNGPATRAQITRIGHDVWIGHGAYIRAGVSIGNGAIVAARAVVARDVPPYAVVAGNPAEVKRYRHPPQMIAALNAARWWRFAPWQMSHLDPSDPGAFCAGLREMDDTPAFAPDVLDLRKGLEDTGLDGAG